MSITTYEYFKLSRIERLKLWRYPTTVIVTYDKPNPHNTVMTFYTTSCDPFPEIEEWLTKETNYNSETDTYIVEKHNKVDLVQYFQLGKAMSTSYDKTFFKPYVENV